MCAGSRTPRLCRGLTSGLIRAPAGSPVVTPDLPGPSLDRGNDVGRRRPGLGEYGVLVGRATRDEPPEQAAVRVPEL